MVAHPVKQEQMDFATFIHNRGSGVAGFDSFLPLQKFAFHFLTRGRGQITVITVTFYRSMISLLPEVSKVVNDV